MPALRSQGRLRRLIPTTPMQVVGAALVVLVVIAALAPSWLAPSDPTQLDPDNLLSAPSWKHLLGTNELGQDLLSLIIYSVQLELIVAAGSTLLATVIGIATGTLARLARRPVDSLLSGAATGVLSFPLILLGVLVIASFGASATSLLIVLAVAFWPQVHLLVRDQIRTVNDRDFVTAARLLGVGTGKIVLQHLIPNSLRPLLVLCPQLMAIGILTEAGLSFLGLGVQPPEVSWGTLLLSSKNYYQDSPWYPLIIGIVITATSFLLMLLGDRWARRGSPDGRSRKRTKPSPRHPNPLPQNVSGEAT
ncbi:ABC transporter permease [Nakamurella lactea]|uniref:ABC transporter permease n=1 Tax=Nakamurella lactea TaxID=459515 RepID=UPI0012B67139|nr:ABC transporter permease [Nakamurella lactea]